MLLQPDIFMVESVAKLGYMCVHIGRTLESDSCTACPWEMQMGQRRAEVYAGTVLCVWLQSYLSCVPPALTIQPHRYEGF